MRTPRKRPNASARGREASLNTLKPSCEGGFSEVIYSRAGFFVSSGGYNLVAFWMHHVR